MRNQLRKIIRDMAQHFLSQGETQAKDMVFADDDVDRVVNEIAQVLHVPTEEQVQQTTEEDDKQKKERDEALARIEEAEKKFID